MPVLYRAYMRVPVLYLSYTQYLTCIRLNLTYSYIHLSRVVVCRLGEGRGEQLPSCRGAFLTWKPFSPCLIFSSVCASCLAAAASAGAASLSGAAQKYRPEISSEKGSEFNCTFRYDATQVSRMPQTTNDSQLNSEPLRLTTLTMKPYP